MSIVLNVTDFGARPDTAEDAVPAIQRALAAIQPGQAATIHFPAGTYHYYPDRSTLKDYFLSNSDAVNPRRIGILIEGRQGITIEGEGAGSAGTTLLFHGKICPFAVDSSQQVTIRDLAIDWVRPLVSEGQVVAVTDRYIDLEIDPSEYPFEVRRGKFHFLINDAKNLPPLRPSTNLSLKERVIQKFYQGSGLLGVMEFDPATRAIPPGTGDNTLGGGWRMYKAKRLAPNRVRLAFRCRNPPKVGNWIVLRHHERDHAGMFLTGSKDVRVQDVNIHATGGLGILAQYCENIEIARVHMVPDQSKRHFVSGRDDGCHFSNNRGLIVVDGCSFEGLMDDPMNVHGTSTRIERIEPADATHAARTRVRGRFMHPQSVGLPWARPGDTIAFINRQSMQTVAKVPATGFAAAGPREFDLELASPIPPGIEDGAAMENLSWTPDLVFRNNQVLSCRARGILISTPGKVLIEKNYFKSSGCPILVAGDANYWWESGAVTDVTIRDNEFSDFCLANMYGDCDAIISIAPVVPRLDPETPFHRNITIERNTFHACDYPVLFARSTTNLAFKENVIERSNRFAPWHPRKATVSLEACSNVTISGTRLRGDVLGKNVQVKDMRPGAVQLAAGEPLHLE